MEDELRQQLIEKLKKGEDLPVEWARFLFPPEKREYELVYHGKEREEDILANTLAVPLQPVRTFGKNGGDGWKNMLIFGDNLQVMKSLLDLKQAGKLCNADGTPGVRLVFVDPPFGTGDEYDAKGAPAYSARIQGTRYIEFIRRRSVLLRELMADDSILYMRIDYHFIHPVKLVLDEVFDPSNFINELIINRRKKSAQETKKYNIATDSILVYSKGNGIELQKPLRKRLCSFCNQPTDPNWHDMISSEIRRPPERVFFGKRKLPPRNMHFTYKQHRIDEMIEQKRVRIDETRKYIDLNGDRVKGMPQYLQSEQTPVDSNWMDLKGYTATWNYPTENAEELLSRVVESSSSPGSLVLDAFGGSGTTCAVAEKLGRRWIGIDCGKLAIYTMQKRFLNLRKEIGNKGAKLEPKPFTLFNAGLYDFSKLKELPWESWRFFALQLFQCRDELHKIGGVHLDGYLKGASVLVFNHTKNPGARFTEETLEEIHEAVGKRVGSKFFIIAPALTFGFQQDYIDLDGVRYYALRIPYSIINELHQREFTALKQPSDELAVNDTVEAVGFDFIRTPELKFKCGTGKRKGELLQEGFIKIQTFKSEAVVREPLRKKGNLETLSMVMLDYNYDGEVFDLDTVFYADELAKADWEVRFPLEPLGGKLMAVFIDIYGNEARVVLDASEFGAKTDKKARKAVAK
jgi:site-specific DNA-methyltransferase (adenine-specific)/adenine-specific DNA-methyltransferase